MAAHKIGKLKFRFKDRGLEMRWGDGEIRRLGLKKGDKDEAYEDQYTDSYEEGADDLGLDYSGRFADDREDYDDYPVDDYADGGYEDEDYGDDGYDDAPYEDEYEDDGYADDSYEDGEYADYEDDGYGDGEAYDDAGYDDEYGPEYDGEYADDGYGDYPAEDYAEYPEGWLGGLIQYVDENDWVTYLLLVLLPPLGIYLLWRRQRFEQTMRYVISAVSAVWFVVIIVLLMSMLFHRGSDKPGSNVTMPPMTSAEATIGADIPAEPTPSAAGTSAEPSVQPSATPISGSEVAQTTSNLVWCSNSGGLYHKTDSCQYIGEDEAVTQVTLDNAKSRNKYACPSCYGGDIYYATSGGKYYHLDASCSSMKNALVYSKEQAVATGKSACPVCVTKTQTQLNASGKDVQIITSSTEDRSGIRVWATRNGTYYHMTSDCSGMTGASQGSLRDALLMGKAACPTCCAASGRSVYCTPGGTYYHTKSNCSGMANAKQVTLAEALVLGKQRCNVCIASSSSESGTETSASTEYYVYGTRNGKYYHINSTCSGMQGAERVLLSKMIENGREACPVCCSGAEMTVYAAAGGTYYHSYATCSGMTSAREGSLAKALAAGYKRCPRCWGENGSEASGETQTSSGSSSAFTATADDVMVYATRGGTYYHRQDGCSGMTGASHISLRTAVNAGKKACPICADNAMWTVYSTDGGRYYHRQSDCSGMQDATGRTLADALMLGQTACPVCFASSGSSSSGETGETSSSGSSSSYTSGTSGIKVYATRSGKYFHTQSNCSGMSGASYITLETALNYGKEPCSTCCASASKTVYATRSGKYYHSSKSCAGSGAVAGSLAKALARGYTACPYCVASSSHEGEGSGSADYTVGISGVKVYSSADARYYHASKSCAGSGAVQVSLETALNYGKEPCQSCAAFADRTVYAVKGEQYYHASRSCAGDNAVAGTYAKALVNGLKACPSCIGGDGSSSTPTNPVQKYTAPANTKVYIDLYSEEYYYHKSSSCSGTGMSGGTSVTLQFVKDLGYRQCPHCNPPSDIG